MYILENISLAIAGLMANKMRAILTMLGIIIGIGSVIAIVMVGDSMTASVSESMQNMGATNIIVSIQERDSEQSMGPPGPSLGSASVNITEDDLITDEMLENFSSIYADKIEAISTEYAGGTGKAQDGRVYANITLMGINDGYSKANNIKMIEGRGIKESDIKSNRYVAVVTDKFVKKMFASVDNVIGKEVKINANDQIQTYTIVGVYKYEATGFGGSTVSDEELRTNFYIPISTCMMMESADKGYKSVKIMAKSSTDSETFTQDIKKYFDKFYINNSRFEINAMNMEAMMSSMTSMLGSISIAIAVIAAISLLVGGIGVMNIMLVSVTERTREIGTRRALGAKSKYILVQFVVESIIICMIGGIIGVVLGLGMGFFGSSLLGYPAKPSLLIIVIAVLFSMAIGVFFGYYPARKAAQLDPIEALRYE
jgi:putative ABC transport system permease protein